MKSEVQKRRNYIPWIDAVRFLAILGVILCHVVDTAMAYPPETDVEGFTFWTEVFKTLSRPSVALFVLLTGYLLLPVKEDSVSFYKKRLGRILYPFLIWSVLYNVLPLALYSILGDMEAVKVMFPYYEADAPTWKDSLMAIVSIPFTFNILTYPLWYVYMLVGLYFLMPVISPWVERSSKKERNLMLVLWLVSLFIPYIHTFVVPYVFGEAEWNEFGMLYYFSGFVGYIVLGSIVKMNGKASFGLSAGLSVLLFCLSTWATYEGYHYMMSQPGVTPEGMELFFMFCTPNVMVMTLAIFSLVSRFKTQSKVVLHILPTLSGCGFGIYMVHYLFIGPIDFLLAKMALPIWLHIPVCSLAVFAAAWAFILLLKKLPRSKFITG